MALIDLIAVERAAVADDIEALDAAAAATPSLCGAWTVHEVAAHLIVPFRTSMPAFLKGMVLNGFDFDRLNVKLARATAEAHDLAEIAATLRANQRHPFKPPGLDHHAPLTDIVVHGQDVRRPLGLTRAFPPETLRTVLDFVVSPKAARAFVPRSRLAGLALHATDIDWRHGDGPVVEGPAESVIMAVAGRSLEGSTLSGDGVELLRARLGS